MVILKNLVSNGFSLQIHQSTVVFVKKEFSEKKSFTMYFQNLSIYSQTYIFTCIHVQHTDVKIT
jgi:hypothetical protein